MTRSSDTSLGGDARSFPKTTWGLVSRLDPAAEGHRAGLEELCRRYWKPVYRYARIAWAKSNEDAKELTQAFFLWLLEGPALQKFRPDLAGFRTYLKMVLDSFISHRNEALRRLKRGGGTAPIPIDSAEVQAMGDSADGDPARAFDREWMIEAVHVAVERVRARCAAGGREADFRIYEAYDLAPEEGRPTYEELAARHGLSWQEVRSRLGTLRQEVRQEIRAGLADTLGGVDDIDGEWNALFGS